MKFREYDNLFVKVFRDINPSTLEWVIKEAIYIPFRYFR